MGVCLRLAPNCAAAGLPELIMEATVVNESLAGAQTHNSRMSFFLDSGRCEYEELPTVVPPSKRSRTNAEHARTSTSFADQRANKAGEEAAKPCKADQESDGMEVHFLPS